MEFRKLKEDEGKFLAVVFVLAGLIVLYNAGKSERNFQGQYSDSVSRIMITCIDVYTSEFRNSDYTVKEFYDQLTDIQKRACKVIARGEE